MSWMLLSLMSAIFEWMKSLYAKKLTKNFDEYTLAFSMSIMISMVLMPYVMLTWMPTLWSNFLFSLFITSFINSITLVLMLKALKLSDISLVAPLFTLSPVFLLITSPFIVWEFPSFMWLMWIILVLMWTYILNFKNKMNLDPFITIFKNKWQSLMMIVTLLWSISSNYFKMWMNDSSPMFFMFCLNMLMTLMLLPMMIKKKEYTMLKKHWKTLFPLWFFWAMTSMFQWTAVSMWLMVYVLSMKSVSMIVSVMWGSLFFNEKKSLQSMTSVMMSMTWVILMSIFW